jgi:hypothetical protein
VKYTSANESQVKERSTPNSYAALSSKNSGADQLNYELHVYPGENFGIFMRDENAFGRLVACMHAGTNVADLRESRRNLRTG